MEEERSQSMAKVTGFRPQKDTPKSLFSSAKAPDYQSLSKPPLTLGLDPVPNSVMARGIKQKYNILESFGFAFKGIFRAIKKERNLKIHLGATILAISLGQVLKITSVEWLALVIIIVLVISAEIFNSSIEAVCNLLRFKLNLSYYETYWVRNFAAGAVMILAIGSLIIGIIIFLPKIISLI